MKVIEVKQNQRFNRWTVIDSTPVIKRYGKNHANSKGRPVRSFLCRCDCGTERIVRGDYLHRETSKSCGCLTKEVARTKGRKQRTKESYHNLLICSTKSNAKQRHLFFDLTKEEHLFLIEQPCFYCGLMPIMPTTKQAKRTGIPFPHHGIDRKDSATGYIKMNCVSCCSVCNYMKHTLTIEQFIDQCRLIVQNMAQEPNSNTDKLQKTSSSSSVNSSPSSEKLCSQQIKDLIEKYKEPEEARKFLQDAGIIDEQGDLMPPYQPVNSTEGLDPDDKSDEPQRFSRLFF
jgi:hypothetical protein